MARTFQPRARELRRMLRSYGRLVGWIGSMSIAEDIEWRRTIHVVVRILRVPGDPPALVINVAERYCTRKEKKETASNVPLFFPRSNVYSRYTIFERLSRELLLENLLQGLTILGKLLDAFVELVEGHRILEKCPAELGLVVNVRHLGQVGGLGG